MERIAALTTPHGTNGDFLDHRGGANSAAGGSVALLGCAVLLYRPARLLGADHVRDRFGLDVDLNCDSVARPVVSR